MTNMTETDSNITRDDRDEIVITKGYGSITRSYNAGTRDYNAGTRGYDAGTKGYKSITRSYKREKEGAGTIGLD